MTRTSRSLLVLQAHPWPLPSLHHCQEYSAYREQNVNRILAVHHVQFRDSIVFCLRYPAASFASQTEITLLNTTYKRTTESTGTLLNTLATVRATVNESLWTANLLT